MVTHHGNGKGTKATMGLWCKLGIIDNVNDSIFVKWCQWRGYCDKIFR